MSEFHDPEHPPEPEQRAGPAELTPPFPARNASASPGAARGGWLPPEPAELRASFPQYEIRGILGRGGMGAVYQGWQTSLDRLVAIKILPPQFDGMEGNFVERFKREAKAMARFSHPGIVAVHDAGETADGLLYIVMEYIEGTDVHKMVRENGPLPPEHALAIAAHVCDALAYAHQRGVIHRDIKPSNIMVDCEGRVKVADFGLAKLATDDAASQMTGSDLRMGTPDFMAPEAMMLGIANVDQRADIYAVGVMLYQMLTGKLPRGMFEMPSISQPGLDVRFDAIVARAMQNDPNRRYGSTTELRADLDRIFSEPVPHRSAPVELPHRAVEGSGQLASEPAERGGPGPVEEDAALSGVLDQRPMAPRGAVAAEPHRRGQTRAAQWGLYAALVAVLAGAFFLVPKRPAKELPPPSMPNDELQEPAKIEARPAQNIVDVPPEPVPSTEVTPMPAPATPAPALVASPAPEPSMPVPAPEPAPSIPAPATPKPLSEIEKWLAQVDAIYQPMWRKEVVAPHESSLDALKKSTMSALDVQIAAASRATRLQDALAYRNERQRIESDQGVAADDSDAPPAELKVVRESWRAQFARIEADRRKNASRIFEQYDKVLATNQNTLTQRQRLDEALQLQQRRDALKKEWLGVSPAPESTGPELARAATPAPMATPVPSSTPPVAGATPLNMGGGTTLARATKEAPFVNTLGMKFVPVPGTKVLFCIHETRNKDYAAYARVNRNVDRAWQPRSGRNEDNNPVVIVTWLDATAFCAWLSKKEGKVFRLPTDHEWSCAVGIGGLETESDSPLEKHLKSVGGYPWGGDYPPSQTDGNYGGPAGGKDGYPGIAPVMRFKPNALGIYDLGGNAWEWCEDFIEPVSKAKRVSRGAAWNNSEPSYLLSSYRLGDLPTDRYNNHGFRCVVELPEH